MSVIILIGKFADVSWVATKGLASTRPWIQLLVAPAGGVLGAFAIGPELPGFMTPTQFALFGLIIGIALAFGSRAYDLVVLDVIGHNPRGPNQPLKGTMVFGFAFSLALAYHFVRYVS